MILLSGHLCRQALSRCTYRFISCTHMEPFYKSHLILDRLDRDYTPSLYDQHIPRSRCKAAGNER